MVKQGVHQGEIIIGKPDKAIVDDAFECYNEKVLVPKRRALEEN